MNTWKVQTLDVWGHAGLECFEHDCDCITGQDDPDDGVTHDEDTCECSYTVNDVFTAGSIEVPANATNEDIWNILCEAGFGKGPFDRAEFEDPSCMGERIEISEKETGMPVFYLEKQMG